MNIESALKSQYHAALKTLRYTIEKCPDALWDDPADGAAPFCASSITRSFTRTSIFNKTSNPSCRGLIIAKKRILSVSLPGKTHGFPNPVALISATKSSNTGASATT